MLVGVHDDGTCASLPIDDELLVRLSNIHGEGDILPLPSMTVKKRRLNECEVAVVTVQPSADPPVRYRGRVWIRVGPSVREASVEDERLLSERRRAADLSFDSRPASGIELEDLDTAFLRDHYLPAAVAADVLDRNRRTIEEQLRSLRLMQAGRPTWGALLALGRDPQGRLPGAYVQFLRIDGIEITDPIRNQKELTGRLDDVVRRLDDLLDLNVSVPHRGCRRPAGKTATGLSGRCLAAVRVQRDHAPQLRRDQYPGPGVLVRGPNRNCQPGWAVRSNDPRELRKGRHGLPQSPFGRDHAQLGVCAALRVGRTSCT